MAMDLADFGALAKDYNVVPLVREVIADHQTPISLAAKLRRRGPFFLLESIEGGEKWGRYSILGCDIRKQLVIRDGTAILRQGDVETELPGNPIEAIQDYLGSFRCYMPPGLPRFFGGAVGYFAFESVQYFERCGKVHPPAGPFADAQLLLTDKLIVFDNVQHTVKLVCCVHSHEFGSVGGAYAFGQRELDDLETLVAAPAPAPRPPAADSAPPVALQSNLGAEAYQEMVRRAKQYIVDGDIIQVVLAQHFRARVRASAFDVYRALRFVNPSPYMYYLELDDGCAIAGSSPEVMVRVCDGVAELRPIAGTRPRGADEAADQALAEELLADPKELAEHVMLVDLARNDLGRIARTGTVDVTDYLMVERYSHVMHLVSNVRAQLRPECDAMDVFKASFPAGTLSGAPKVRAMEIINELEPARRGPYGGALGYIGFGARRMDLAITIRTLVMHDREATVTAGAGIVFDSDPARENQECLHKSDALRRALELAERGLVLTPPEEKGPVS